MTGPGERGRGRAGLPRVVQIGFNRCGTKNLKHLFRASGHKSLHLKARRDDGGEPEFAALVMRDNLAAGRKILAGLERFIFLSDLEYNKPTGRVEGYRWFREIHRDYPDTIFLLNLREKEGWLRSRSGHNNGRFIKNYKAAHGLGSDAECLEAWSKEWDEHIAAVRGYFADKPGHLIEYVITDPIETLVARLPRHGLDPAHWNASARAGGPARPSS